MEGAIHLAVSSTSLCSSLLFFDSVKLSRWTVHCVLCTVCTVHCVPCTVHKYSLSPLAESCREAWFAFPSRSSVAQSGSEAWGRSRITSPILFFTPCEQEYWGSTTLSSIWNRFLHWTVQFPTIEVFPRIRDGSDGAFPPNLLIRRCFPIDHRQIYLFGLNMQRKANSFFPSRPILHKRQ